MKTLDYPDLHYLNAALGWLELGNPSEAREEAERISIFGRVHEDAFLIRWRVAAEAGDWEDALRLAEVYTRAAAENVHGWLTRSYCLYRLDRPLEAWTVLAFRASKFPEDSTIPYLLACYAAESGNQKLVQQYLTRSTALGGPNHTAGPLPLLARFGLPTPA